MARDFADPHQKRRQALGGKRVLALLPQGPWRCDVLKITLGLAPGQSGRAQCALRYRDWTFRKETWAHKGGRLKSQCTGCATGKQHSEGKVTT